MGNLHRGMRNLLKNTFSHMKRSLIWQVIDESAKRTQHVTIGMCLKKASQPTGAHSHIKAHTQSVLLVHPPSEWKAADHRLDMNVFPLIVPCCFTMWQETEPSLFTRWAVAPVQTAPCAHSALNGPWNQSHLTVIMPFNIQNRAACSCWRLPRHCLL